jgi:hypothetical protein
MRWRKQKETPDLDLFTVSVDGEKITDRYLTGQELVTLISGLALQGLRGDEDIVVEKVLNG